MANSDYINGIKQAHQTNGWIVAVAVLWPIFAVMCLDSGALIIIFMV